MYVLEIRNEEMMTALSQKVADMGIRNAAIVALIGAADSFSVSTMPADDPTSDIVTDYELPAEMSGTGEVRDGQVHIHAVMAVAGDRAISGHLHRAEIGTWFARIYVQPCEG